MPIKELHVLSIFYIDQGKWYSISKCSHILNAQRMNISHATAQNCAIARRSHSECCNIFYIYRAFIVLFHKALHPPSFFLSICLSFCGTPSHFLITGSGLSLRVGHVDVFFVRVFLQSNVRHINRSVTFPHWCSSAIWWSVLHWYRTAT